MSSWRRKKERVGEIQDDLESRTGTTFIRRAHENHEKNTEPEAGDVGQACAAAADMCAQLQKRRSHTETLSTVETQLSAMTLDIGQDSVKSSL